MAGRARWLFLYFAVGVASAAGSQPIARLGAIGDSLSDEYFEATYSYARNWTVLLVEERGVAMGPLPSPDAASGQPEGGTWGEPRRAGYEDNWARSGATSDDVLSQGQHTGLAEGVASRGVTHAVVFVGALDCTPTTASWNPLYLGTWTRTDIDAWIAGRILNLRTILDSLLPTGVHVVLASPPDVTASPLLDQFFPSVAGQERVAAAMQDLGAAIRSLADEKRLVFADGWGLMRALFGSNATPRATLLVGDVAIDMAGRDDTSGTIPTAAFVDDGVHPNTVLQGVSADLLLTALRHYGATQTLFSESEILAHAGLAYGGTDTLETEIGAPLSSFVADFHTLLVDGFETGTTDGWSATVP